MKDKTQVDTVHRHLTDGKAITPVRAQAVYGIYRLSSVIEDLRESGLEVDTVFRWDEAGKQYGEYRMRRSITRGTNVQVKRGCGYGLPNWVCKLRSAKVIAKTGDASLVRFVRGKNLRDVWMNDKELVNAD